MVTVPDAEGVNVTVQLAVAPAPATSVQLGALNVPAAPLLVKLTLPDGEVAVPVALSVTVAVHVLAWPMLTGDVQEMPVVVPLGFTVMLPEPELVACVASPP